MVEVEVHDDRGHGGRVVHDRGDQKEGDRDHEGDRGRGCVDLVLVVEVRGGLDHDVLVQGRDGDRVDHGEDPDRHVVVEEGPEDRL